MKESSSFLIIHQKKKTNHTPTAVEEFLQSLLYTDLDRYFFGDIRLNIYFSLNKDYDYYYDEYKYVNQYVYIGEILNSKTIDSTGKPVFYGLYCERIFGPIINYSCRCKKYYNLFFTQKRCDICFIELINSKVRRYRMSYTELLYPVIQLGYIPFINLLLKSSKFNTSLNSKCLNNLINLNSLNEDDIVLLYTKSKLVNIFFSEGLFFKNTYIKNLDIFEKNKKFLIFNNYFNNFRINYIIKKYYFRKKKELIKKYNLAKKLTDKVEALFYKIELKALLKDLTPSYFYQFVTDEKKKNVYNSLNFQYLIGADIIRSLLEKINLKSEISKIYYLLNNKLSKFKSNSTILLKKLRILESFYYTKIELENLIISFIPILSPNIRPYIIDKDNLVMGGDINTLYKLIIENNNLIMLYLFSIEFSDIDLIQIRYFIQQYVNCLINMSKNNNIFEDIDNKDKQRNIISILKGKEGHFRNVLLGKRVDYSGRTVITPGPYLRINQCGIPYDILCNLFEIYVYQKITRKIYSKFKKINLLKKYISIMFFLKKPVLLQFFKQILLKQKILLNRAPTLHKYGIQSFDILINLNQNLRLHPLVCEGFNADFDGDQMGIHIPLSNLTNVEYINLMQTSSNIFSLRYSQFIVKPTHEMIIGCYYLSLQNNNYITKIPKFFTKEENAFVTYFQKKISLHQIILINYNIDYFFSSRNDIYIYDLFDKNAFFKINIYKCFFSNKKNQKFFLFTNIGLIFCEYYLNSIFYIKNFFYKTTLGKLFFYNNCKNIIKNLNKLKY